MPALTASLPSPVLRALPFPANVSIYPTPNSTPIPISTPSGPQCDGSASPPGRTTPVSYPFEGGGIEAVRFVHRLLESLDGLSETLTKLGKFSRPENDQDDEQNQNQLGKPNTPKHGRLLSFLGLAGVLRSLGEPVLQPFPGLFGLLEHFALLIRVDQVVMDQRLIRIVLDCVFHHFDGDVYFLVVERDVHQLEAGLQMLGVQLEGAQVTLHRHVDRVVIRDCRIIQLDIHPCEVIPRDRIFGSGLDQSLVKGLGLQELPLLRMDSSEVEEG